MLNILTFVQLSWINDCRITYLYWIRWKLHVINNIWNFKASKGFSFRDGISVPGYLRDLTKFQNLLLAELASIHVSAIIILHCMHNKLEQQQQSRHRAIWTSNAHVAHVCACARTTDVVTLESMIHVPIIVHTFKRVSIHAHVYGLQ